MFASFLQFISSLTPGLKMFVIISFVILLFAILISLIILIRFFTEIIKERGLPNFSGKGYYIEPKKNDKAYGFLWEKEVVNSKDVVIGKIGFYKDLIIFRIFGEQWNSSTPEGIEGYKKLEQAFNPPEFLSDAQRSELTCFIFVNECRLQSRLIPIIHEKSEKWKKVYVICTVSQYENNELNQIDTKLGLDLNIEIIKVPDVALEIR